MDRSIKKKRYLMVAPCSPPITGQSIATELVYEALTCNHEVVMYNTSKNSLKPGINSIYRVLNSVILIFKLYTVCKKFDCIYYTVSQSLAGACKDVIVFLILWDQLDKFVLHSHGFGLRYEVLQKSRFIHHFYLKISRRVRTILVLGETHKVCISEVLPEANLKILTNCAAQNLFVDDNWIIKKFSTINEKIKLVFLSNLLPGKGHLELLQGFAMLPNDQSSQFELTFAGGFLSENEEINFKERIKDLNNVFYAGVLGFDAKCKLLHTSHVFCLPTYYAYEGQPISILEAYASGCVVLTTPHAGIPDICSDRNGFIVTTKSSLEVYRTLQQLLLKREHLQHIGKQNLDVAKVKFSEEGFKKNIVGLLR